MKSENPAVQGPGSRTSESVPELIDSQRQKIKRAIFAALRHWLAHGTSDFEQRRLRTMADAARKGRKA